MCEVRKLQWVSGPQIAAAMGRRDWRNTADRFFSGGAVSYSELGPGVRSEHRTVTYRGHPIMTHVVVRSGELWTMQNSAEAVAAQVVSVQVATVPGWHAMPTDVRSGGLG